MIKTQILFMTLTFAILLNPVLLSAQPEEKKSDASNEVKESRYKNLSKEIRKVASDVEQMVYHHRYKTKSDESKKRHDITLNKISHFVAQLQDISVPAINKLSSQRKTVTKEPISFDDPSYKTLARSIRRIASQTDKIVAQDDKNNEKNKTAQPNDALEKIGKSIKQLNDITTPIVQEIKEPDQPCAPILEAGSNDAGIEQEKEGRDYKIKHRNLRAVSCDLKRVSTW